jgi:hypothetical protein
MENKSLIPEKIFEIYKNKFESDIHPNIIRLKNITQKGIDTLIEKNKLEWSYSIFDNGFMFQEGLITWGDFLVLIYFQKIENDSSYKIFILTDKLADVDLLIVGLNKFFTIDKI